MIYKFTRMEPIINPTTNNVIGWIIGLTAIDGDYSAYIDAQVDIEASNQKPLSEWSQDEIRIFAIDYANKVVKDENGNIVKDSWFTLLKNQIEQQKGAPIRGTNIEI